ncbi:MAG: hypothetical protein ABL956_01355 [Hyphomonadaceae bacterium]
MIITLSGYSGGPQFIGHVSDLLFAMHAKAEGFVDVARAACKARPWRSCRTQRLRFCRAGETKALQNSLLIRSLLYFLPAVFFMLCLKTLQKDLVAK